MLSIFPILLRKRCLFILHAAVRLYSKNWHLLIKHAERIEREREREEQTQLYNSCKQLQNIHLSSTVYGETSF